MRIFCLTPDAMVEFSFFLNTGSTIFNDVECSSDIFLQISTQLQPIPLNCQAIDKYNDLAVLYTINLEKQDCVKIIVYPPADLTKTDLKFNELLRAEFKCKQNELSSLAKKKIRFMNEFSITSNYFNNYFNEFYEGRVFDNFLFEIWRQEQQIEMIYVLMGNMKPNEGNFQLLQHDLNTVNELFDQYRALEEQQLWNQQHPSNTQGFGHNFEVGSSSHFPQHGEGSSSHYTPQQTNFQQDQLNWNLNMPFNYPGNIQPIPHHQMPQQENVHHVFDLNASPATSNTVEPQIERRSRSRSQNRNQRRNHGFDIDLNNPAASNSSNSKSSGRSGH